MIDDSEPESGNISSRGWIFTIHNYTVDQVQNGLVWLETAECLGISAGLEIAPKTGTPHIQGYVRLNESVKKGRFRKIIGPNLEDKSFWMKAAKGDWAANAKYTSKDGNVIWHKVPPVSHQGVRNDLIEFRDAIKRKAPDDELFEHHLSTLAKYPRLEGRLKFGYSQMNSKKFRKVEVIVHWGDAGTGKTKAAFEQGAYIFDDYEDGWWDGYNGESVVCLDDFYGGVKYAKLLRLLDGYPIKLKQKGSFIWAEYTTVYITSNKPPSEWYSLGLTPALKRRITKVIHFNAEM